MKPTTLFPSGLIISIYCEVEPTGMRSEEALRLVFLCSFQGGTSGIMATCTFESAFDNCFDYYIVGHSVFL